MAEGEKLIASNRRARHEYFILEAMEAGLALTGTEVKSLRAGRASLVEAYARVENGEAVLVGAHIPEYSHGNRQNHEPTRPRKLLLHRREIDRLQEGLEKKGLTIVALRMYWKNGRAKIEIALARGKKQHDKRDDAAKRESDREIDRIAKRMRESQ